MARNGLLAASLALAGVVLMACDSPIAGVDPDTGIELQVTRGPIQPVAREGESNEAPVEGAVVEVRATVGDGRLSVVTDAAGLGRAMLRPGAYRVRVTDCPGAMSLPAEELVTVTAGRLETTTLSCDTGIR